MSRVIWMGIAGALVAAAAPPTFNRDIAPILYKNCATCHRPGEVAPFSLLTYQDAAKRAKQIATVTHSRFMPPWRAEPGYGTSIEPAGTTEPGSAKTLGASGDLASRAGPVPLFQNERRLTDDQIAILGEWAANGAPEGDAADTPTPPVFAEGWQAGQPDKVFTLPAKFSLAADGPDQYRCFVVPMNLDHDVYVKSFEFRAENRHVVHHAIIFTDPTGASRKLAPNGGSYPCFGGPGFGPTGLVGGWAPGGSPGVFGKGMELTVAKGTDLVLQIHYHPSGKPEQDQSSLGMTFGDAPTIGRGLVLMNSRAINIPAGESHYVVKTGVTIPQDVEVLGITPHAHYLAKDMKIDAHLPDGSVTHMIWIKDWDFNWQGQYRYSQPVKLPKGTRVELEYTYDNSAENARNPSNPPKAVHWGEQTTDEMAVAFMSVKLASLSDEKTFQQQIGLEFINEFLAQSDNLTDLPPEINPATRARLALAIGLFDRNHDGKLDADERKALMDFLRARVQ